MFMKSKYSLNKETAAELFNKNSPAYVISNEDLRLVMNTVKPNGKDVLTVAGSGDQPLFFQLAGAKIIDTFDISINSKRMMNVKLDAIKSLNYDDYYDVMKSIAGGSADFPVKKTYLSSYYMPLKSEYMALKEKVNKPYNFIQSDLYSLYKNLNKKYDIFYFSNIIQYDFEAKKIIGLLNNLRPFMNNNALIVLYVAPYFIMEEIEGFRKIQSYVKKWAGVNFVRNSSQMTCVVKSL